MGSNIIISAFLLLLTFPAVSQNWIFTDTNGPSANTVNDIAITGSGTLIAATTAGLFRSTNSGSSWTRLVVNPANLTMTFHDVEVSGGTILANFASQLYKSTDDGVTWTQLTATGLLSFAQRIEIAANGYIYASGPGYDRIFRSTNNGASFQQSDQLPSFITDIDTDAGNRVIVSTNGSSVRVSADGVSFNAAGTGLSATASVYSVVVLGSAYYALSSTSIWRSTDNGVSWTDIKGAIADGSFNGFIETDGTNLYVGNTTTAKIHRTGNPTASPPTWTTTAYNVSNGNTVYCGLFQTATTWYLGREWTGVDKTTDTGANFSLSATGMQGMSGNFARLFRTSGDRLFYAFGGVGYFLSIDDGNTWSLVNVTNANRRNVDFIQLSDGSILGYGYDGVIRTTNQGSVWSEQTTTLITNISSGNGIDLYNFSGTTVNKSINQGVIWTSIGATYNNSPSGTILKGVADNAGNLYLRFANGLWKINSGATVANKLTIPTSPFNDLATVGANVFVIGNNLSKSIDGGANWTTSSTPTTMLSIWAFDNNNLYVASTNAFYNTTDGGSTWTARTPVSDAVAATVSDLVISIGQTLFISTNFGRVQKSSTPVVPPLAPSGLIVSSRRVQGVNLIWTDNANNEQIYIVETSLGGAPYQEYVQFNGGTNVQGKFTSGASADSLISTSYRVRAFNQAGYSAYSNEVSATGLGNCKSTIPDNRSWTLNVAADPGSTPGPGPFTNAAVSIIKVANSKNQFTVGNYALGVTPLAIHSASGSAVFADLCGQTAFIQESSGRDIANGNATWNGTNTIVLKWQSSLQFGFFEGTTTFTLNPSDPAPVSPALTAIIHSSTQNILLWTRAAFATQYVIERSTTSGVYAGPPLATINDPLTQYFDAASVVPGTTYYYRITAKNGGAGPFTPSTQVSITPPVSTLFSPLANDLSTNFDNQQGVSWADMDGDGDEDYISVSFSNAEGLATLPVFYENIGGTGQFTRRSIAALANEAFFTSRGAHAADFNNDGKLDIYFPRAGLGVPIADLILINNGNWNFTKVFTPVSDALQFKGVALLDAERDGLVDFFFASGDGSASVTGTPYYLRNTTTGGTFSLTQSNTAGAFLSNMPSARTLSTGDFNNDGLTDILQPNYNQSGTQPNPNIPPKIFKNNGDGTFDVVTGTILSTDIFFGCRTSGWGDIDNDGDMDLFLGSAFGATPRRLYQNNGDGTFTSLTSSPVATETTTANFGSAFGDIDNDGDLDLITINSSGGNSIFINGGTGNFTKYVTQELLNSTSLASIGGSFVDYDNNGFLDFAAGKTGTAFPPYLYKNTLTASASRNWTEIKLVGTGSNRSGIGARIKVVTTSPVRSQIREVTCGTGYASMSSLIQHFGLGTATSISQIQIRWPNGGTQTWTNPPAGQTMNQVVTLTEDVTGPTLAFTPANGAANVTLVNTITLTLNEPGTLQAAKNITVRKGSSTSTPIQVISVISGTPGTGNTYSYTLSAPLDPLSTYYISVDAGSFTDMWANQNVAVLPTQWSFTTIDNVLPTVSFTPPSTLPKAGITGQVFNVTAADNISVTSVVMSYKKITATQYQTLTGTLNGGTGKYDFPLQATFFDDMGMEYYFIVTDGSANTARSPATGTHITRLTFPSNTIAVGVAAGSTANDYKIISIPLDLATNTIANIFADFGAPDIMQWRLLKYQHSPQAWLEYPNSFSNIARGEGYFILSRAGKNLQFNGATAPTFSQTSLFSLNLSAGFNLIGNPYTMPIDWEDTRTGVSGVNAIKVVSGGNYVDGNTIDVFGGGFVFANAAVAVTVKLKTSLNGGRTGPALPSSRIEEDEWIVPIRMTEGQREFNLGGVGMSPNGKISYDDLDDFAPPSLTGEFEISFAHPEHFMKKFSRDVVLTQPGHTWSFTVQSDSHLNATLHWDNSDFKQSGIDLFLLDVALQRPVDMRNENSYQFDPSVSKEFRVYFGTDARDQLKPERLFIGHAFPNPASGVVNIPFNLPESTVDLSAKVEILDAMGRTVETILNTTLPSGFYTASWDAGASTVVDGFYIVRVAASYDGKQQTVSTKLIVHK